MAPASALLAAPVLQAVPPQPWEERLAKLEKQVGEKRKDRWDKAQIMASFLSSVIIAFLGWYFSWFLQKHQEQNEFVQVIAQLESSRQRSDTEMRAKMFQTLIEYYFEKKPSLQQKRLLLSLFHSNFQEYVNTGALFATVGEEIQDDRDREEIKKLARTLVSRQEVMLGAGPVAPKEFKVGVPVEATVGGHKLDITLAEVISNDRVKVQVGSQEEHLNLGQLEFEVNYFDMPLMENTKLPNGHRFAITLKSADREKRVAMLKVFELDHDRFGMGALEWDQVKHQMDRILRPSAHVPHDREHDSD